MSSIILGIIMIFLSLVGVVSIIKAIIFKIFSPKEDTSAVIVSINEENLEKAEFLLRSWGEKLRWSRGNSRVKIICLDRGLDESTKKVCEAVSREYGSIEIMTCAELKKELKID